MNVGSPEAACREDTPRVCTEYGSDCTSRWSQHALQLERLASNACYLSPILVQEHVFAAFQSYFQLRRDRILVSCMEAIPRQCMRRGERRLAPRYARGNKLFVKQ